MKRPLPFACSVLLLVALGACSKSSLRPPSLAPRPSEAIDPRLPVERPLVDKPASAGLRARLAELVAEANRGATAFDAALGPAERAVAGAGAARSEGWIAAQEALSALEASRAPTAHALGEIDAIAGTEVQRIGDVGASDRALIDQAEATVQALAQRQSAQIQALSARLGR